MDDPQVCRRGGVIRDATAPLGQHCSSDGLGVALDRWQAADPVPRSRSVRLWEAGRRLEADLTAEGRGNTAYEAYRAGGRMKDGRRFGKPPTPYEPPAWPQGKVNLTDPDSHVMKGNAMFMQAYNAQALWSTRGRSCSPPRSQPGRSTSPSSGR